MRGSEAGGQGQVREMWRFNRKEEDRLVEILRAGRTNDADPQQVWKEGVEGWGEKRNH